MSKIKTAVIGVGLYGEVHARSYALDPRTELACVWSRSERHARAVAKKYQCCATTDIDAIANDRAIEIVSIATPDFAHTAPAVRMLEAGKHVLLEKPMAMSVADCRRIMAAQKQGGGKLMVNFHNRWYPPLIEAKKRLDGGEIGNPAALRLVLSDRIEVATEWLSWAGQSGPEWFLFPHIVDLMLWLLNGRMPGSIYAVGRKGILAAKGVDCYDRVQALLDYEGLMVSLESSWILPASWPNINEFGVVIAGEKGRMDIKGDFEGLTVAAQHYQNPFVLGYITEEYPIHYFVDCVQRNITPTPGAEDGLKVTAIIEDIVRSMNTKRSITNEV